MNVIMTYFHMYMCRKCRLQYWISQTMAHTITQMEKKNQIIKFARISVQRHETTLITLCGEFLKNINADFIAL